MYFFLKQKLFSPLSFFMDIIETSLSLSPPSLSSEKKRGVEATWLAERDERRGRGGEGERLFVLRPLAALLEAVKPFFHGHLKTGRREERRWKLSYLERE